MTNDSNHLVEEFSESAKRLDAALNAIDRHGFISSDHPEIVAGRSIPATNTLRQMLAVVDFPPNAQVLQIGAGSGYVPAVLSQLADKVIALEKQPLLVELAGEALRSQSVSNVDLRECDGSNGAQNEAPFDVIVISTPAVAGRSPILKQLKPHGQLICLENLEGSLLTLVKYVEHNRRYLRSEHGYIDFTHSKDESLIETGIVTRELLEEAQRNARTNKTRLIDELQKLKNLDDVRTYRSLAKQYGLVLGNADSLLRRVQPKLFGEFSRAFLDRQHLLPLYVEGKTLKVATHDPKASLQDLQQVKPEYNTEKVLVTPTDFRRLWSAIDICLETKKSPAELLQPAKEDQDRDLLDKQETLPAHLIVVFEALLLDAVAERASDIHLEQYGDRVRVRLRIDGELRDLSHFDISVNELRGLINVIKIRTEMNIAERRLPQGGRSRLRVGGAFYDLRVQVQPSLHGEHVVIRLLPQRTEAIGIEHLGLPPEVADSYRRLLNNPAGLVLVVGPTGSGKTTTLYAGLQLLAADKTRKVITVEDPIEYSIDNIQQTRVRPEIGFHFADAMRSFVRQDPDVILVGEIRDTETALEAIRASQTGHVVLSTLHSNDTVDAMQRLFDLDIKRNSLASELLAIIAQRLAKRLCPHCRESVVPDPAILAEVFPEGAPADFTAYRGRGCEHCNYAGTHGRVAVVEYLPLAPDMRDAISRETPVAELRRLALEGGLVTMRDSALAHVSAGTIALEELPRLLPAERMAPEARTGESVNSPEWPASH